MKKNIPLFKISTSEKDIAAVSNVIRSKASWAVGDSIKDFENHINKLNKTKYAVVFNSGTSALIAMIISSGLKKAEIIVPSFSFISTASSVILSGNKIKFSDIETDSYGLSYKDLKNNVTKKDQSGNINALLRITCERYPKDIKFL